MKNIVGNVYDKYNTRNPIARWLMACFLRSITELYNSIKPSSFLSARVEVTGRLFERDDWSVLEVRRIRIVSDDYEADDDHRITFKGGFDDDIGVHQFLEFEDLSDYARFLKGSRVH